MRSVSFVEVVAAAHPASLDEAQLRGQVRSQVKLGNEGEKSPPPAPPAASNTCKTKPKPSTCNSFLLNIFLLLLFRRRCGLHVLIPLEVKVHEYADRRSENATD
jgi:hypothetical protein